MIVMKVLCIYFINVFVVFTHCRNHVLFRFCFKKNFFWAEKFPHIAASLLETVCWSICFELCAYLNQEMLDVWKCDWKYCAVILVFVFKSDIEKKFLTELYCCQRNAHFILFCFVWFAKVYFWLKTKQYQSVCVFCCIFGKKVFLHGNKMLECSMIYILLAVFVTFSKTKTRIEHCHILRKSLPRLVFPPIFWPVCVVLL